MTAIARTMSAAARPAVSQHQKKQPEQSLMPQPWAGESPAEELHTLSRAFEAVTDLITPPHADAVGMNEIGRDQFSGLMQLLVRIQKEGSELAENYVADCFSAIADLSIPEQHLHCVNREHLASLLHVIQRMQSDALSRLFKANDA